MEYLLKDGRARNYHRLQLLQKYQIGREVLEGYRSLLRLRVGAHSSHEHHRYVLLPHLWATQIVYFRDAGMADMLRQGLNDNIPP